MRVKIGLNYKVNLTDVNILKIKTIQDFAAKHSDSSGKTSGS